MSNRYPRAHASSVVSQSNDATKRLRAVVSRTELIEHLYDQDFDRDSNTIEVFVGRLRKKVSADLIETVRGLGYRIVEPGNAA